MALEGVNRYADLIKSIVKGSFYASKGTVLPYRSGETELRLTTRHPNTHYGLYVNSVYIAPFISDAEGNVTFSCHLERGDVSLELMNLGTGQKFTSYVTVREYAIWLAAYSEVLEGVDDDWKTVKDSLALSQATIAELEAIYGAPVGIYNNLGQGADAYRYMLMEVRDAYRNFGGRFRGTDMMVSAITQVPPFGYSRRFWGPNWVLDQSMLSNHRLTQRASSLAFYSGEIEGVSLISAEADVISGTTPFYILRYNAFARTLQWGNIGAPGPEVGVKAGEMFLPGPSASTSYILGSQMVVTLNTAREQFLYLDVGAGIVTVDVSTWGSSPTLPNLVTSINAAIPGLASVYNSKLLLSGDYDFIKIESGKKNAAVRVFGVRQGDIKLPSYSGISGVTLLAVRGDVVIHDPPISIPPVYSATLQYDSTTKVLHWWSTDNSMAGSIDVSAGGNFTVEDSGGNELDVHVQPEDLPPTSSSVTFSMKFSRSQLRVPQIQGLWVQVNLALLPVATVTRSVRVLDSAKATSPENSVVPDAWRVDEWTAGGSSASFEPSVVITDRDEGLSPCPAFRYFVQDSTLTMFSFVGRPLKSPLPGPERGSSYPQKAQGFFYDYEGFEATWSAWFLNHVADTVTVTLGFSFDDGLTWMEGGAHIIEDDEDAMGYEYPTFVSYKVTIPAGLEPGKVWVRAKCNGSLPLQVSMDAPRVDVNHITSRALSNTTVVRTRHRQALGELMYVWSNSPLTLTEQKYLGTLYKTPDIDVPLSGVKIVGVSQGTSAGTGLVEHRIQGAAHQLRWSAVGEAWGSETGWVGINSDISVDLASPSNSILSVQVILEDLSEVDSSKNVLISDYTLQQGSVREIAPAQSPLDIIDATEYDAEGNPLNLVGVISEGDFSYADLVDPGLVNLDIAKVQPAKYSFLYPTLGPVVDEALTFSYSSPFYASLAYSCDQDRSHSILKENGIPYPDTLWEFTGGKQVHIINSGDFDSSAEYTLSYSPLYQITTPIMSLGDSYQNYMWIADYLLWDRLERGYVSRMTTSSLLVDQDNGVAELADASSLDVNLSTLYYETESGRREIPRTSWSYLSDTLIRIDPAYYISRAIYIFTYQAQRLLHSPIATVIFEHRSGVDTSECEAASWRVISRNENVDVSAYGGNHALHQLRLSLGGIKDVQDFRIRSLVLKGLNVKGPSSVKGILNV